MKQTLGLLALLGVSQTAFAEDSPVRIPAVKECSVGNTMYRVENPLSENALFQVYSSVGAKKDVLIDSFPMNKEDAVYGRRLDFLLDYDTNCEGKP